MSKTQLDLYRIHDPRPTYLSTPQIPWMELGTITVQQAYPAVGARDYTSVAALAAANRVIWPIHNSATGLMLRFQTNADSDAHTVQLLGFADAKMLNAAGSEIDDHAMFLGQLALVGGQQVGPHSNVYVDQITATDGIWTFSGLDAGTAGAHRIAAVKGDTRGIKIVVFVVSALQASATLYIEGRTY